MTETVLITGASGYVASHIVRTFLEAGYHVKGTVRSQNAAQSVRASHPGFENNISFVVVPDMTAPSAFHDAVKGVIGVIHTASPFKLDVQNIEEELLEPAVRGTQNILEAAATNAAIRRVVMTESVTAVLDMSKGLRPGYTYSEKDWNPATWEDAAKSNDTVFAYATSKSLSEKVAWEWVEDKKPGFELVTILPPWIFGPSVNGDLDVKKLGTSMAVVWGLVNGSTKEVPPTDFPAFVDVRDVALAHLRAFEVREAGGQRFLTASHFDYQTAIDVLRDEVLGMTKRLPKGNSGAGLLEDVYSVDASKATNVLGFEYIPLKKTMRDSAMDLLEAERRAAIA